MKTKPISKIKGIKRLQKSLVINKDSLSLELDIKLTDKNGNIEYEKTKKGDSFVANFLRLLYLQMARDIRAEAMGSTMYYRANSYTAPSISSITSGSGAVFRLTFTSTFFSSSIYDSGGKISLGGFQGITLEGIYDFVKVSSSAIDITGTTYSAGWTTGTGGCHIFLARDNFGNPSYNMFGNEGIIIGSGTTPVTINDFCVAKLIPSIAADGGLVHSTSIVAQDTNDAISAQITMTRSFVNNGAVTVSVNEVGYLMNAGTGNYIVMVMRDILPDAVNVAAGKTLTINYRIKTTLGTGTDPGGFVTNFMRLMYRHIQGTSRAAIDINNTSRELGRTNSTFLAVKCGGINTEYPQGSSSAYESESGYKHGIIVGRGNTAVSMGDYYLETPITHGVGENQMLYYGGFAEDFTVGADYAEFTIKKAMENVSGATISINEYALIVGSASSTASSDSFTSYLGLAAYLYLITRNVLDVAIDVLDDEVLITEYKIRVAI